MSTLLQPWEVQLMAAVLPPKLRRYQEELLADIEAQIRAGKRRILVVLPTGGGKTVVFAQYLRWQVERRLKAMVLAHRRELIKQTSKKLRDVAVAHSIIMAGHPYNELAAVQVASVQTLSARGIRNETMEMPECDVVIIDEAHHCPAQSYKEIIEQYPKAIILGFTATPIRGDGRGLGGIFEAMVRGPSVQELIDGEIIDGRLVRYLVPTKVYAPFVPDLKGVKTSCGDYVLSQLEEKMDQPKLVGDIVEHWFRYGENRPTVAFASGVGHSRHIIEAFQGQGVPAGHVDGRMPKDERDATLAQLAAGELKVVSNFGVLTEGWDMPEAGCCVVARPTKNPGLYLQIVGRVLRPADGKEYAIVLDHAGCTHRHGFAEDPIEWALDPEARPVNRKHEKRGKDTAGADRIVECTQCGATRVTGEPCAWCGFMPVTPPKYVIAADGELGLISRERRVKAHEWTNDQKEDFYRQLLGYCEQSGKKPGMAFYKFQEKFKGEKPPFAWKSLPPLDPTPEVSAWLKSRAIAWAKGRKAAA